MGFEIGVPEILIILSIVALIFGTKRLNSLDDGSKSRIPVYSAETIDGQEAEFIRDRLPKRFPTLITLVVIVVFGAAIWWLTR